MINRRIIRIKALQILYAFYNSPDKSLKNSEKELFFSIQKTYDLYHLMLNLVVEIQNYAQKRIDAGKQKFIPTPEDLNPNTRFADNKLIHLIRENTRLETYLTNNKLSWNNYPELIKKLYNEMKQSPAYEEYMSLPECSFTEDRKFIDKLFIRIILECEDLYHVLEEQSIYWNDDTEFVVSMIIKTLKKFKEDSIPASALPPMFKDDEDYDFARDLFRKVILNHDQNKEIIEKHLSNWDIERVAYMDTLLMELAITEFTEFVSIPTKVSLNEYIELSKYYSTERSSTFINGILDRILKDLKDNHLIQKAGRGLLGEE
ncbi:MAG: transcription antitermination factor NusB [Bacteroidota bacterium]|nr:transcription antitermination factor NusB [Bacteroidota bacterium]